MKKTHLLDELELLLTMEDLELPYQWALEEGRKGTMNEVHIQVSFEDRQRFQDDLELVDYLEWKEGPSEEDIAIMKEQFEDPVLQIQLEMLVLWVL